MTSLYSEKSDMFLSFKDLKGDYFFNPYTYEDIKKNVMLTVFRKTFGLMLSKMFVDKEGV